VIGREVRVPQGHLDVGVPEDLLQRRQRAAPHDVPARKVVAHVVEVNVVELGVGDRVLERCADLTSRPHTALTVAREARQDVVDSCQPQSPSGNRGKGTPPMLKVITTKAEAPAGETPTIGATLDDLARAGARRMIAAALHLEVAEYVARFREARDEGGHALVVRNGTARPRPVTAGVGPVTPPSDCAKA
jgi:hypothetical protein